MKITIELRNVFNQSRYYIEIEASMPFEMFGLQFAAHQHYEVPSPNNEWRVSELSTGMGVCDFYSTRTKAISVAKEILEKEGEEKVKKYVKKHLRRQKKEGRKL